METLLIGLAVGFGGGFTAAWLFAGIVRKEIATLAQRIDGFALKVEALMAARKRS